MKSYDLIVLGGGAGGLVVAAGAASLGASVALVDKGELGGDCLWTGCVPTKSLVHSASLVSHIQEAEAFGYKIQGKPNFAEANRRMQIAIDTIRHHDAKERFEKLGIDVYQGIGQFVDQHVISILPDKQIYGSRIVIATGSRPKIPQIPGLLDVRFWTNEQALQANQAPEELLVIGGGPIGLELAQVFSRFGSKVTVAEMENEILAKEDQEMVAILKKKFEQDGFRFSTRTSIKKVERFSGRIKVTLDKQGSIGDYIFDQILVASGRIANTDQLELERAGIQLKPNSSYIEVNRFLQTNRKHIYAIGDVNGAFPFTHKALYEGKLVVSNAVLGTRRKVDYRQLSWVTFTDPELYHLGLTEKEARQIEPKIKVYRTPLSDVDRFITDGQSDGLVKIITRPNGKILGAHAVGKGAGDMMQEVAFAMHYQMPIGSISHVIHPYPTHVGSVQRTADLFWREKIFQGSIPKWIRRYIRFLRFFR